MPSVAERVSPFVSSTTDDVYAIYGLPEEVISVLFAYVSRSPLGFRENLAKLLADGDMQVNPDHSLVGTSERARKFHEKWVVEYGHSCYDEETEVLTKHGWKRWSNVSMDDKLASVNPETLFIEYLKPENLIREPYQGPMYKVQRNKIDMLVTPNHRIWACPMTTKQGRKKQDYSLFKAEDLYRRSYALQIGGLNWQGELVDQIQGFPAGAFLEFMGFFIGDGWNDERYHNAVQFHLKKESKIRHLENICARCGLEFVQHGDSKFYIRGNALGNIMRECYDENGDKIIPEWVFELDRSLLLSLFRGLMASDGSDKGTTPVFDSTSRKLIDQIQHLSLLLGLSSSISLLHPAEDNRKDGWRIFFNQTRHKPEINKVSYDPFDEWVEYNGMVYCATLPKYHTLIVRRNGKPMVSGNSVAEHTNIHIGVEKISRIASEDLERSNRYLSFTEYSQRYQQPKRGDWYIPDSAEHLLEPFYQRAYDYYEQTLHELADMLKEIHPDKSEFARTALAGEDARYLLPLGTYTNLGMTGNARAIAESVERLWYSDLPEVRTLAKNIVKASQFVAPTLVRHPERSARRHPASFPWQEALDAIWEHADLHGLSLTSFQDDSFQSGQAPSVYLDTAHFRDGFDPASLIAIIAQAKDSGYFEFVPDPKSNPAKLMKVVQKSLSQVLSEFGMHDELPDSFSQLSVNALWFISEAAWHQLLRHRRAHFVAGRPFPSGLFVKPPLFQTALERGNDRPIKRLYELTADSRHIYGELSGSDAEYAVLNASIRPVFSQITLQDLWHLTRLRTRDDAQHEIRETCKSLVRQLSSPNFLGEAAIHFMAKE